MSDVQESKLIPNATILPRQYVPLTYWQLVWRQLRRNRGAMIAAGVVASLIIVALAAAWIAPYDPLRMDPSQRMLAPGRAHLMGTDNFGRDLFSRIVFGSRIPLSVGIISVSIGATGGIILGLLAGYLRGVVDDAIMRFVDALLALPSILMALAIMAALGSSITNVMIAVGVAAIPSYTRVVRASVLAAREELYVVAARALGCSTQKIMFGHILPNVLSSVVVLATLGVAGAILSAAGLGFLGLGAQPPVPEWGLLLSGGRAYLGLAWWITTFPGLAIILTVVSINMFGDGLRDALDPRLKRD